MASRAARRWRWRWPPCNRARRSASWPLPSYWKERTDEIRPVLQSLYALDSPYDVGDHAGLRNPAARALRPVYYLPGPSGLRHGARPHAYAGDALQALPGLYGAGTAQSASHGGVYAGRSDGSRPEGTGGLGAKPARGGVF